MKGKGSLGHYDPLSSHEIDGVRKEKERLTAVTHIFLFPLRFSLRSAGKKCGQKAVKHSFPKESTPSRHSFHLCFRAFFVRAEGKKQDRNEYGR